jgi:enediyne biosynthesis protein E4
VLLRNDGKDASGVPRFNDVAMATGADDIRDARGMATADFDNDGDLDIVVNNNPGDSGRAELARATLLRNNVGSRRNWLAVELRGTRSNRDAVGAVVRLHVGAEVLTRQVHAAGGYLSQASKTLHFGLGKRTPIDRVEIRWPSGQVQKLDAPALNRLHEVTEPREQKGREKAGGV